MSHQLQQVLAEIDCHQRNRFKSSNILILDNEAQYWKLLRICDRNKYHSRHPEKSILKSLKKKQHGQIEYTAG